MSAVTLDRMSSRVCDCVATSPENQDLRVCESLPMQLHSMRMHSQQDTGKLLHGLRQPNQRRKLCFNVVGLGYKIALRAHAALSARAGQPSNIIIQPQGSIQYFSLHCNLEISTNRKPDDIPGQQH